MKELEITYGRLNIDEVNGTTQADYLISVDADLRILQDDTIGGVTRSRLRARSCG